jgi:Xaa-Pro aminopeptidase
MECMADSNASEPTTTDIDVDTEAEVPDADSPAPARAGVPASEAFREFISGNWAERTDDAPEPREQAPYAAARRAALSQKYPGKRLIIPAGAAKVRSNDTDFMYRAHSAFSHLTGWGSDSVADSVLVLEPTDAGHEATLYFRESAGRDSDEFYANAEIGAFWTGPRPPG